MNLEEIRSNREIKAALTEAFLNWYGANDRIFYDGGIGDVVELYLMLLMAAAKAVKVAGDAPYSV
jgi:hypothetical protein